MVSEKHIIRLLQQQDKQVIAIIYDQYAPALFGVICRIVRSEALAEDVLQESFIKIWKSGTDYQEAKGRLFTWLLNIARNTAIDATRSAHYRYTQASTEVAQQRVESNGHDQLEVDHIGLRQEVERLETKYREVVDLIYFNGYTQVETAEALQVPLGTVKTRLKIGLRELRKIFCASPIKTLILFVSIFG